MNLKRLELFGFKSFMRKLDVHFSDGITVIVGPNGCGKTNVTDALRWVLGEGSVKVLRGSKMEDLIFNGTRDFKPLNVAEVSLTVDNSAGILPTEYAEVTVTRRVFRSGESEFLINKIPSRLRDVHDLFMDTGLGSRAYSVIEREMVEKVLADQPEKRRELLEEAAGIMKYKIRERQAQRKLAATDEDLHRIDDVLREVERQVRSLKRQVGAAQRFQEIRDRQRALEVQLAAADLVEKSREVGVLAEGLRESTAERDGAAGRVAALGVDIENLRAQSAESDASLSQLQREVDEAGESARLVESENLVRRERRESLLETSRRLAAERQDLEERVRIAGERREEMVARRMEQERENERVVERLRATEAAMAGVETDLTVRRRELGIARETMEASAAEVGRLTAELATIDSHSAHLGERDRALAVELSAIESSTTAAEVTSGASKERVHSLRDEFARRESELAELLRRRDEIDAAREQAREEESRFAVEVESTRSRLEMLRGLRASHEGFDDGARALLAGGSYAALADSIHVNRPDLIAALDGALQAAIQFVVAPSANDAIRGVRGLKSGDGRATVVDLEAFRRWGIRPPDTLPDEQGIVGPARSFLDVPGELGAVLDEILARTVIVETLEDAVRLATRSDTRGFRFVSREGDWAEHPGIIHGGAGASNQTRILGRADRIAELEEQLGREEERRAAAKDRSEQMTRERALLVASLAEIEERREESRRQLMDEDRAIERITAELSAAHGRLAAVREEKDGLANRLATLESQREAVGARLREAEMEKLRLEEACRAREEELVASTGSRDDAQRLCHDLRLEEQRVRAEFDKLVLEITRMDEARQQGEDGIAGRARELEGADRTVGELARDLETGLTEFAARAEELETRRKVRDRVAEERAQLLRQLRDLEDERTRWTRLRDQAADFVHEQEMKLQRIESAKEELVTRVEREFSVNLRLADASAVHGALLEADTETREAASRELDDLRRQMDRMGAVNLVALDQYERESKRYEFLKTQKDDLEEAREQLRRTIRKINRTARSMFMETLEQVRANFQRTFGTLFEGGQADIRLAGDEDPLHAPIEIVARPRGKRLSSISLMSSGERSLTAVAFLFAIYLVKPSPFCILDEVDAPLDDANIGRFLDMLKEVARKTQFVMITHNKKTMEIADFMYGVTMEDPGISKLVSVRLGKGDHPEFGSAEHDGGTESSSERELVMESSA